MAVGVNNGLTFGMKEAAVETKQRPLERTSSVVLVHFLWHKFEPNLIPGRGLARGREVSKSIPKVSSWRCRDSWRQSDSWNGFKRHLQLTLLTLPSSTIAPMNKRTKKLEESDHGVKSFTLYSNQLPHSLTQTNLCPCCTKGSCQGLNAVWGQNETKWTSMGSRFVIENLDLERIHFYTIQVIDGRWQNSTNMLTISLWSKLPQCQKGLDVPVMSFWSKCCMFVT